jgi:hypothetical protein
MSVRSRLDYEHPCLACGGPWEIIDTEISVQGQHIRWAPHSSMCARDCLRRGDVNVDEFNTALAERHSRGW